MTDPSPQFITLEDPATVAVFVKPEKEGDEMRVFYDMQAILVQYVPVLQEYTAKVQAAGDHAGQIAVSAQGALLRTLMESADVLRFQVQMEEL